jgi:DNA-binding MarR family transcriptional regulator
VGRSVNHHGFQNHFAVLRKLQHSQPILSADDQQGHLQMARKSDEGRLDEIRHTIQQHPGKRPGRIARLLGLDNRTMMRALPQLEARGDLLSEDENGRLYWFRQRRHGSR